MSIIGTPNVIRLIKHDGTILYESKSTSIKTALEEAISQKIVIRDIDLSYKDLSFANLDEGHFVNVNFTGANLMGTNLSECSISGCDFTESQLIGACLAYGWLNNCDFKNTEFACTDFACARIHSCSFSGFGVFYLDFSVLEKSVNSYIYDDCDQKKLALSDNFVHVFTKNKRAIIGENMMIINGKISAVTAPKITCFDTMIA